VPIPQKKKKKKGFLAGIGTAVSNVGVAEK
jgi:hypothetical protein